MVWSDIILRYRYRQTGVESEKPERVPYDPTPAGLRLSQAHALPDGGYAGTATVRTNVGNGTIYFVVTTSAAKPTAEQIKAGEDENGDSAVFAGDDAVSSSGVQGPFSLTGLDPLTQYWVHFVQEDDTPADSNIVTASFTTAAVFAGVPTYYWLGF